MAPANVVEVPRFRKNRFFWFAIRLADNKAPTDHEPGTLAESGGEPANQGSLSALFQLLVDDFGKAREVRPTPAALARAALNRRRVHGSSNLIQGLTLRD